jgi:hypothetical protein
MFMCRAAVYGKLQQRCAVFVQRVWRGHCSRRDLFASLTEFGGLAVADSSDGTSDAAAAPSDGGHVERAAAPDISDSVTTPTAASSSEHLLPLASGDQSILSHSENAAAVNGDDEAAALFNASAVSGVDSALVANSLVDALLDRADQFATLSSASFVASTNRFASSALS